MISLYFCGISRSTPSLHLSRGYEWNLQLRCRLLTAGRTDRQMAMAGAQRREPCWSGSVLDLAVGQSDDKAITHTKRHSGVVLRLQNWQLTVRSC